MKFTVEFRGNRHEFELPDEWYEEQGIHIMWGGEHMAMYQPWNDIWRVKTARCSRCGDCCRKVGCPHLNEHNLCSLGVERPWFCCVSMEQRQIPNCTISYKEVNA